MTILGYGGIVPLLGMIPAIIAERKGRQGFLWWIYGTTLVVFALPHALMLEDDFDTDLDPEFRPCPSCAEPIRFGAKIDALAAWLNDTSRRIQIRAEWPLERITGSTKPPSLRSPAVAVSHRC